METINSYSKQTLNYFESRNWTLARIDDCQKEVLAKLNLDADSYHQTVRRVPIDHRDRTDHQVDRDGFLDHDDYYHHQSYLGFDFQNCHWVVGFGFGMVLYDQNHLPDLDFDSVRVDRDHLDWADLDHHVTVVDLTIDHVTGYNHLDTHHLDNSNPG